MYYRIRSCFHWNRPLIVGLVLVTVALGVFAGLAEDVWSRQTFPFDLSILSTLSHSQTPLLTLVMEAITTTASVPFLVLAMLLIGVLWWRDRRGDFLTLAIVLGGALLLNLGVKALFERARPTIFPALVHASGYSFPSGHSQAAIAFYGMLAYLIGRRLAPARRIWLYLAAAVWILLVGLSRMYLGVHFPSDVFAAYTITVPWILAGIFFHQCFAPPLNEPVPAPAQA